MKESKIWALVEVGLPDSCWRWLGRLKREGNSLRSYYCKTAAARIIFEISYKKIPGKMHVCHRCDNPSCVNPTHLFLGTHRDNMEDMKKKGRTRLISQSGTSNPRSKLTESQVIEIRNRWRNGETLILLAKEFGISKSNAFYVANRIYWKHVP